MKEVLLISNLDIQSPDILRYVSAFCKHYGCKLHIIHFDESVDPVLLSATSTYSKLGFDMDSFERREDLIKKIKTQSGSYIDADWVNITIKGDREAWFIDQFISKNQLDLLIVGQNIFKKYHDHIGASIRDTITLHTMTPMLVLPPQQLFKPIETVNYLLKEMNDSNLQHMEALCTMMSDITIKLTHIIEDHREALDKVSAERWMNYVKKHISSQVTLQLESADYSKYIQQENYAITQLSDLLVFSTYNRNFWDRIIDPSTTLRQLSTLQIPALIFKHRKSHQKKLEDK